MNRGLRQNRSTGILMVAAFSVVLFSAATVISKASYGATPSLIWQSQAISIPPNSIINPGASLNLSYCESTTFCITTGTYYPSAGLTLFSEIDSNGTWNAEVIPLPPNATKDAKLGTEISLNKITCVSTSFCVAVGTYTDSSQHQDGLIEMFTGGAWQAYAAVPNSSSLPGFGNLSDISCLSITYCVAVGSSIETYDGQTWSYLSPNSVSGAGLDQITLNTVSCTHLGDCFATGVSYSANNINIVATEVSGSWTITQQGSWNQPHIVDRYCESATTCYQILSDNSSIYGQFEPNGTWLAMQSVVGPNGVIPYSASIASDLFCSGVGCEFFANMNVASGRSESVVVQYQSNAWISYPITISQGPTLAVTKISAAACTTSGMCIISGTASPNTSATTSQNTVSFLATAEVTGPISVSLGANLSIEQPLIVQIQEVSCSQDGSMCIGIGYTQNLGFNSSAPAATIFDSGGMRNVFPPMPPNVIPEPEIEFLGLSCSSSTWCEAIGTYTDNSQNTELVAYTYSNDVWSDESVALNLWSDTKVSSLSDVQLSCGGVGSCIFSAQANPSHYSDPWLTIVGTLSSGNWSISTPFPGLDVSSLTCPSSNWCAAVGHYPFWNASNYDYVGATYSGGTWVEDAFNQSQNLQVYGYVLDCPRPDSCIAASGEESYSIVPEDFLDVETLAGMSWSDHSYSENFLGSASIDRNGAAISISCPNISWCGIALGNFDQEAFYGENEGSVTGALIMDNGSLSYSPFNSTPSTMNSYSNLISCPTIGYCIAAVTSTSTLEEYRYNQWSLLYQPDLPGGTTAASYYSVECPAFSNCFLIGNYTNTQGFVSSAVIQVANDAYFVWVAQISGSSQIGIQGVTWSGLACPTVSICMASGFDEDIYGYIDGFLGIGTTASSAVTGLNTNTMPANSQPKVTAPTGNSVELKKPNQNLPNNSQKLHPLSKSSPLADAGMPATVLALLIAGGLLVLTASGAFILQRRRRKA